MVTNFLSAIHAIVIFTVIPVATLLLGGSIYCDRFTYYEYQNGLSKLFIKRSGLLFVYNACFAFLLCLNQTLVILNYKIESWIATDFQYYLKVDDRASSEVDALRIAQKYSESNCRINPDCSKYLRRRLTSSSSGFLIIYYAADWENILGKQALTDICHTENLIKENVKCLDFSEEASFINDMFNTDCTQKDNKIDAIYTGLDKNKYNFFDDGFNPHTEPRVSHTLWTSFKEGTCGSELDSMDTWLKSCKTGNIELAYVNGDLLQKEFMADAKNDAVLAGIALAVTVTFLVIWIRGFLAGLMTVFCIFISMTCSAALLPNLKYEKFSFFNMMCVFILVGVGANAVLLFNSSWNRYVPRGQKATPMQLLNAYTHVGEAIFFVILAAMLSLFSKIVSPVIVISQLGVFMGMAVVVFYVEFHLLIIPLWIVSNRYTFPTRLRHILCTSWTRLVPPSLGVHAHPCEGFAECLQNILCTIGTWSLRKDGDVVGEGLPVRLHNTLRILWTWCEGLPERLRLLCSSSTTRRTEFVRNDGGGDGNVRRGDGEGEGLASIDIDCSKEETKCVNPSVGEVSGSSLVSRSPRFSAVVARDRGVRRVGACVLLLSLVTFILVTYFTFHLIQLDQTIPQIVKGTTNLGRVMTVYKMYKKTLFSFSGPGADASPGTSQAPSESPSSVPTPKQTVSSSPTLQTTAPSQTIAPLQTTAPSPASTSTSSPSVSGTKTSTVAYPSGTSFTVTGCWGLNFVKKYIDGDVTPLYSANFGSYVKDGLISDLSTLCKNLNSSRQSLGIDPSWDVHKDCLSGQLSDVMTSDTDVRTGLLKWAIADNKAHVHMLGVNASLSPTWVCMQLSPRTQDYVDKTKLMNQWKQLFINNSPRAQAFDVDILVVSDTFKFDNLAAAVLHSVVLAALVSIAGFVGLLFFFTFDVSIVISGTFVMVLVIFTTLCIHLSTFTPVVDLLDIVVLIAIMAMIVDFPIHLIKHFLIEQSAFENTSPNELSTHFPTVFMAIKDTLIYMSHALLGPMLMTIIAGIPLLFATLSLLSKTGEYMIVMIISSYFITMLITPALLVLCPRTRCWYRFTLRHE